VLAWSPALCQGVSSETRNAALTSMAASTSQAVVLGPIRRGSGGGAPVGRRWRLVRLTAGGGLAVASVTTLPASAGSTPRCRGVSP